MSIGEAPIGQLSIDEAPGGYSFTLSPSATHATGSLALTASGFGTSWGVGNPFSIVSGPASSLTSYVNISGTAATFSITVTSISSTPIIITDGTANFSISAAAVVPGQMTAPTVSDNNDGSVSVNGTDPVDNGGASISSYVATWSDGTTNTSATKPVPLVGVANLVAGYGVIHAVNSAGAGPDSVATSTLTPDNHNVVSVVVRCPYFSTDAIGTKGYQLYQFSAGSLVTVGSHVTTGFFAIPNITDGFTVVLSISPNQSDGSFSGLVVFDGFTDSLGNDHAALEVQTKATGNTATISVCKVARFVSTDVAGGSGSGLITAPGYQLLNPIGSLVGSRVTTGVVAIPNVKNGFAVSLTQGRDADGGLQQTITWDTGSGAYQQFFDDLIQISPPQTGSSLYAINGNLEGNL